MTQDDFDRYMRQDAVQDLLRFSEGMDDVLLALDEGLAPADAAELGALEARLADIAGRGRRLVAALDCLRGGRGPRRKAPLEAWRELVRNRQGQAAHED